MGSEKASLKQPLLHKWPDSAQVSEEEEEQAVKKVAKRTTSGKKQLDEQEVRDLEQGVVDVEHEEEEAKPPKRRASRKAARAEVEEEEEEEDERQEKHARMGREGNLTPIQEFRAAADVALVAPKLEHMKSLPWSEKNERALEKWKEDVVQRIKECSSHAKGQANLSRLLVIPATILGAMTTASSGLSALVQGAPALSYAAAGMSLVYTILTALQSSLNPEKHVQAYLTAKDKYQAIKNKIEATLAIDMDQRPSTGAHFILQIQEMMDGADDSLNGMD